ncbi:MAG: hypothetical protein WC795_01000 [Candidatus Paceibacterota bacterium]
MQIIELVKQINLTITFLIFITVFVVIVCIAIIYAPPEDSVLKNLACILGGGIGLFVLYFIPINYLVVAWKVFKRRIEKC